MLLLGIETSCDETAAAVVRDGCDILSSVLVSQERIHGKFGGVVPELACRQHTAVIGEVVDTALSKAGVGFSNLDGIAVTQGPGLIGALLVGISYGKALAYNQGLGLVGVNHLEGHVSAIRLENRMIKFPAVAMVVSGGHTNIYYLSGDGLVRLLGRTVDDAAGEAFDKAAKMLGLPFPGGPAIDEISRKGNPQYIRFPRPNLKKNTLDMSFSGLKTSLRYHLERVGHSASLREDIPHLAASFQQAVVDVLVDKTLAAADRCEARTIFLTGGVAANRLLRSQMETECKRRQLELIIPLPEYCTDNGAMIAAAGYYQFDPKGGLPLGMTPKASFPANEPWASTNFSGS